MQNLKMSTSLLCRNETVTPIGKRSLRGKYQEVRGYGEMGKLRVKFSLFVESRNWSTGRSRS